MATAEQHRELVEKMHEERAKLFVTLSGMSEERAAQANPEKDGEDGWSVKEILAHLASMDRNYRGTVRQAIGGGAEPPASAAGAHYLDGVNANPTIDLIRNMERERGTTMAFIAGLSLEDLDRKTTSGAFGELSVLQLLRSHYRHDRQHSAQIQGRESDYSPRFLSGVEPDQRRRP